MEKTYTPHPAGTFTATVADYGTDKTKSGKDFAYIWFETPAGKVKYTGYLTPAAIEYTIRALVKAGCNDLGAVAEGPMSNAFGSAPVTVSVIHEADQKDPSKVYGKVTSIGAREKDQATVQAGKSLLAQYQGQFVAEKMKQGTNANQAKPELGF